MLRIDGARGSELARGPGLGGSERRLRFDVASSDGT